MLQCCLVLAAEISMCLIRLPVGHCERGRPDNAVERSLPHGLLKPAAGTRADAQHWAVAVLTHPRRPHQPPAHAAGAAHQSLSSYLPFHGIFGKVTCSAAIIPRGTPLLYCCHSAPSAKPSKCDKAVNP
jgi:hypothetical protein